MNANELMKKIEYYADCNARYHMAKFYNQNPEQIVDSFNKAEAELKSMLRQQQTEIEALKKFKAEIDAENKKLFEAVQRANDVWDKATGKAQEK